MVKKKNPETKIEKIVIEKENENEITETEVSGEMSEGEQTDTETKTVTETEIETEIGTEIEIGTEAEIEIEIEIETVESEKETEVAPLKKEIDDARGTMKTTIRLGKVGDKGSMRKKCRSRKHIICYSAQSVTQHAK